MTRQNSPESRSPFESENNRQLLSNKRCQCTIKVFAGAPKSRSLGTQKCPALTGPDRADNEITAETKLRVSRWNGSY